MNTIRNTACLFATAAVFASSCNGAFAAAPQDGAGASKAVNSSRASKTLLALGKDRSTPEQKVAACWTEWYCNAFNVCWWATRCW